MVSKDNAPIWVMYLSSGVQASTDGRDLDGGVFTTSLRIRWLSITSAVMWLEAVHVYWPKSVSFTSIMCKFPDSSSRTRSTKANRY